MTQSVETQASWTIAGIVLIILGIAYGSPWVAVVALKIIAAETGGARSVPAFASSLAWFGGGLGGIAMGWLADRYGVRWTVLAGTVSVALGLAISSFGQGILGEVPALYVGHGLFIGPPRYRGPERAALCVRQPLVRPPPRFGARADLERPVHRRRALAADLRTLDRELRLARNDADVRLCSSSP